MYQLLEESHLGWCNVTQDFGLCQSLWCQKGFIRPCTLCGEKTGARPCFTPGCTAFMHKECRALLKRRVKVYWADEKPSPKWYWGTVPTTSDPGGASVEVAYDDGWFKKELLAQLLRNKNACFLFERHAVGCTCRISPAKGEPFDGPVYQEMRELLRDFERSRVAFNLLRTAEDHLRSQVYAASAAPLMLMSTTRTR